MYLQLISIIKKVCLLLCFPNVILNSKVHEIIPTLFYNFPDIVEDCYVWGIILHICTKFLSYVCVKYFVFSQMAKNRELTEVQRG